MQVWLALCVSSRTSAFLLLPFFIHCYRQTIFPGLLPCGSCGKTIRWGASLCSFVTSPFRPSHVTFERCARFTLGARTPFRLDDVSPISFRAPEYFALVDSSISFDQRISCGIFLPDARSPRPPPPPPPFPFPVPLLEQFVLAPISRFFVLPMRVTSLLSNTDCHRSSMRPDP